MTKPKMPMHIWIIAGLLFLYGLAASFDLFMSLLQGEDFYRSSGMSEAQIAYFTNQPAWAVVGWIISVLGSALGALALLMRKHWALHLFFASVIGSVVYMVYTHLLTDGRLAMGVLWPMPIILTAIMIAMAFYCKRLIRLGILY